MTASKRQGPRIGTFEATAPAAWASYLVNGDGSCLGPNDKRQADDFVRRQGGSVVSCKDAGYLSHHDARREFPLAAECMKYHFIK